MTRASSPWRLEGLAPAEAAAHWRVRHDAGDMSPDELQQFDCWLTASPVNAAAWARSEMAWALFDAPRSDPHLEAMRGAALAARSAWRPAMAALAAASAALLAIIGAVLLVNGPPTPSDAPIQRVRTASREAPNVRATPSSNRTIAFETSVGQRISRRLADGTRVTLNTDSALDLAYSAERRVVRLIRGQALFEVAKDRRRPFVVEAGGREITALGTVFEVRLDPGGLKVLLAEGRVSIARARLPGLPGKASDPPGIVLAPGQSFVARLGELEQVKTANVESALLWRSGLLDFDDVTLAEASAELNRYSKRRLVVRDRAVASLRVSGVFRASAPDRFADAVREVLPVAVRESPDAIEIVAAEARAIR